MLQPLTSFLSVLCRVSLCSCSMRVGSALQIELYHCFERRVCHGEQLDKYLLTLQNLHRCFVCLLRCPLPCSELYVCVHGLQRLPHTLTCLGVPSLVGDLVDGVQQSLLVAVRVQFELCPGVVTELSDGHLSDNTHTGNSSIQKGQRFTQSLIKRARYSKMAHSGLFTKPIFDYLDNHLPSITVHLFS